MQTAFDNTVPALREGNSNSWVTCNFFKQSCFLFFFPFFPSHTVILWFCVLLEQIAEILIPLFLAPLLFSSESLLYFGCVPKQNCDIFWFKNSKWGGKKSKIKVCFSLVLLSKLLQSLVQSRAVQTLTQQMGAGMNTQELEAAARGAGTSCAGPVEQKFTHMHGLVLPGLGIVLSRLLVW